MIILRDIPLVQMEDKDAGEASVEDDYLVVEFNECLSGGEEDHLPGPCVEERGGQGQPAAEIDSKQSFTLHCPTNYPD